MYHGVETPRCSKYRGVETPRCPKHRGVVILDPLKIQNNPKSKIILSTVLGIRDSPVFEHFSYHKVFGVIPRCPKHRGVILKCL